MNFYEKNKKAFLSLIGVLSFFFMLSFYLTPITTNDFWIQLKVGQLIKETFEIPKTILFAFTPEKDDLFVAHEWLPSLIFSLAYDSFGHNFMIVFKFLLYSCSFLLAFRLAFKITQNALTSFFIVNLCLFALNYRSFMRPEVFSYILFLSQLNILWSYYEKKSVKYLVYYVIVNIIWVNSHGSFMVSLGLPFLLAASRVVDRVLENHFWKKNQILVRSMDKQLVLTGFAAILTILVNPLGYHLLVHSYELSQNALLKRTIFEWKPMLSGSVMKSTIFKVFLIFSSFLSIIVLLRFRKLRTFSFSLLVMFTYLAFDAQRHLAFLAVASVWPLAIMLRDIPRKSSFSSVLAVSLVVLLPALTLYAYNRGNTIRMKPGFYHSARIPQRTLNYIKERNLKGNTLNTYSLGGQLIFNFYPKMKIGIDSRIDAYGVEYARRYRKMVYGKYKNLKPFLDRHSVENIIVNNSAFRSMKKTGSYKNLKEEGWKLTHKSSKVVILRKAI